jgi:hypothetical protein
MRCALASGRENERVGGRTVSLGLATGGAGGGRWKTSERVGEPGRSRSTLCSVLLRAGIPLAFLVDVETVFFLVVLKEEEIEVEDGFSHVAAEDFCRLDGGRTV